MGPDAPPKLGFRRDNSAQLEKELAKGDDRSALALVKDLRGKHGGLRCFGLFARYYTGYPKDLGPSRVIHFTSEREFIRLLHEGYPVVVAFTIRVNYTKHLDKVLEEAAAEFYPHVKFMRVSC
ncbi:hypothetical protein K1719_010848 [Acacia pycnantha]|nr:hypothetical protein K1719_010848 [Acacia pycnantha]